jgi:peptidoglycan/LPS O-acetylase OafA/YrhL
MRYNPALDGLRAFAVLIVLFHHCRLLPGGWIGVDVFFVLSGYLIRRSSPKSWIKLAHSP